MIPKRSHEKQVTTQPVSFLPSVSIALPFEPRMTPKGQIEKKLKEIADKVEAELQQNFPKHIVKAAMDKLKWITGSLDYYTQRKSIVIFLSPFFEKIYYLNIPVEEKIIIKESFDIRDLVVNKKEEQKFLLLVICNDRSEIYLGVDNYLSRMIVNKLPSSSKEPEDVHLIQERTEDLLKQTDNGLTILLQSYQLPLFILAARGLANRFLEISKNAGAVVDTFYAHLSDVKKTTIQQQLTPFLKNWKGLKEKFLMRQLKSACDNGKLLAGIHEVWKGAREKKGCLLLVEKSYVFPAYIDEAKSMIHTDTIPINTSLSAKDVVDDAIEHVLADGGDVEFVEDNALKDFMQIVLVQQ